MTIPWISRTNLAICPVDWPKEGQQSGATISKHDYTFDDVSNRLTHAITASANKSYTYTYNDIYELTGVSGTETSSFAYDNVGNRTTANGITYVPNNLNQYSTVNSVTHTYSNNGNLTGDGTNTYGYDVESRLTSFSKSGTTASYTYDAFNRRVSKTVNGTTIYYVYDGDDIIEERSSAGALNADWVHGDEIDEPLTMTRGGTTYYYTRDALGSVRELTNSAGAVQETYTYNSYGQLSTAPTIANPFTFTGREYDVESGNYYYRARYYSPTLGRFLQRDPIGYYDSMNLFSYTVNNPVNFIDPSGLLFERYFTNEKQLGGHSDEAVTYQEFIRYVGNRSLPQMQTEKGDGGLFNSSAKGPRERYRYVIDPANPNHIIDMRHFLVVGPNGEFVGMYIETMQYANPEDRDSAFDAQDFLSNYLGSEFYRNYYLRYISEMTFSEILQKYFNERAGKPCP